MNDVTRIISELERQRTAIERAISALREVAGRQDVQNLATSSAGGPAGKKRQLSPEGRQRIIDATKRRWAAKRAASKQPSTASQGETGTGRKSTRFGAKRGAGARKKAAAKTT